MAKKRSKREPQRPTIVRRDTASRKGHEEEPPAFLRGLGQALHGENPSEFLEAVSGILEAVAGPAGQPSDAESSGPGQAELVDSLIGTEFTITTAVVHAIGVLTPDEVLTARIKKALRGRIHALPAWLRNLEETEVVGVTEMRHVQRDGEDYLLDVRLPAGFTMTVLVYVDNNMAQIVKDALVVPVDCAATVERMRLGMDADTDEDTDFEPYDAADARACVEAAIRQGRITVTPLESDTWPQCRPLVEWLVRLLPAGGAVPPIHEWTQDELDEIAERFLASRHGRGFDDDDHRGLLHALLWLGASYDLGDPLRWTPVNVEIVLVDRAPRKIADDPAVLAKLPDLLRAVVRFAHAERGLRAALTDDTLASVRRWEGEYQQLIREEHGQSEGLAQWLDGLQDDVPALERAVGGVEQLEALTGEELPDEAFDWSDIPDDIAPKVAEILRLCDENADELLDVEHRTANRRLLRAAVLADPAFFRGRATARTSGAAISWMVAHANDSIAPDLDLTAGELLESFGVKSATSRAKQFLTALGLPDFGAYAGWPLALGSPDYLVAEMRLEIIEIRDDVGGRL